MPRELYNEGRVVGYSAYEMYLRHHLGIDPDHSPASEKEWLASMMAMGSSMLLRIGTDDVDGAHYIEVEIPKESRLCAANNILASFFSGKGYVESDPNGNSTGWATKVTDYGPLIANSSASKCPSGDGTSVPANTESGEYNDTTIMQIREYMKITDGIVIQPGTWTTNINKPPYKDFTPMLSEVPKLRIALNDKVETPFYVLFTGFTNRTVVDGQTGFDSSVNTQSAADGDFLGPWAFPWAAKVFFHIPSSFFNYFMNNKYTRELPNDSPAVTVKSDAIIDMKQNYQGVESDYYESTDSALLDADVININITGEDAAIVASYMHKTNAGGIISGGDTKLPPALYGALINQAGTTKFIPLDTIAPGSLKLYHSYDPAKIDSESAYAEAVALEYVAPRASGFLRDDTDATASYVVYQLNSNKEVIPVSNDVTVNVNNLMTVCTDWIYFFTHDSTNRITTGLLQSVDNIIYEELISGYISSDLINEYGISKFEYDSITTNLNGYLRFYGQYWDGIKNPDDYVAIVSGPKDLLSVKSPSEDGPQMGYIIANKYTGQIASMGHRAVSLGLGGFDFTSGSNTDTSYDINLTDFLGTWWNQTGDKANADNNMVVLPASRHPHLKAVASSYASTFYQDKAFVPYCPDTYPDFRYYFDSIKFSDFLSKFGKTEDDMNLHDDFKGMTLQQALKTALVKDMTCADSSSNKNIRIYASTSYYYDKSTLEAVATSKDFSNCYAKMKVTVPQPHQTMFDMRLWSIYNRQSNNDDWSDITQSANRADKPIYAAVGQSGHNSAVSISLVDKDNILLNTSGTSKTVECDTITWSDLLFALNMNQRLDLLKGAVFNRDSNNVNYIVTANGTVLYISNTEPTGDIPDGAIGIGW